MEGIISIFEAFVFIFAVLNLVFAVLVYVHSDHDKSTFFYAGISFFASLWSLATIVMGMEELSPNYFLPASISHYVLGNFAYLSFFWFSIFYPFRKIKSLILPGVLSFLNVTIVFIVLFWGNMFQVNSLGEGLGQRIVFDEFRYSIFIVSLSVIFIAGLMILASKIKEVAGYSRTQTLYVFLANLIAGILGIFLNLILPFLGNFNFFLLSPILVTLALTGFGLYCIFKYHFLKIKLIFVEAALVLLNLFLLFNLIISRTPIEFMLNILVFVAVFIFGIVLLRGIYKDIRDRDLAENLAQEMIEANKRLEQMEEQKVEFVAIASHQLRTPLTVIKGYTSMILEGTFGFIEQSVSDAVKKIYDASEKVIALVEDLLAVSRLEHGRSALQFAVADFSEIVKEMVELVGPEIKKAGLDLHFFVEEKKFLVLLDEKKIKQILRHILENTFKYTLAPGSVRVVLVRDSVTGNARLLISDTGNGMSKEQIRKLFVQYEFNPQDDMTTQLEMIPTSVLSDVQTQEEVLLDVGDKVNHTSGIGLYLAKEIIGAHQGTLLIESAGIKKGTTIIIELPCQNDEEQE